MNQQKYKLLLLNALLNSLMLCPYAWSQHMQISPVVKTMAAQEITIPHATKVLDLKTLPVSIGMDWSSETEINFTRNASLKNEFPGRLYNVRYNLRTGQETLSRTPVGDEVNKDIEVTKQSLEDVELRIQAVLLTQNPSSVVHGKTVRFPSVGMTLDDVSMCRKNGRIAWIFASKYKPFATSSARITPNCASLLNMEIWISHSNGTHMRRLGTLCHQKVEGYKPITHEIHWLPSGQRISFISNNSLYIANVGK